MSIEKRGKEDLGAKTLRPIKQTIARMKTNPVGTIAGGAGFFLLARRVGKISNPWVLAGATVLGMYVGASTQRKFRSFGSRPTKRTVQG
jgi:hypothetical protein